MFEAVLEINQHVEGGHLAHVESGVTMEHFEIEAKLVEADDQVSSQQLFNEIIDLVLAVNAVIAAGTAIGDPDAHAHSIDVVPAADFVGGTLSFEIEIDNVSCHGLASEERAD